MGVTLKGNYKDSPCYDMGYITFFALRKDIAYAVSKEFGNHYAKIPVTVTGYQTDEYDRKTEELITKYKCKNRFLDFLYMSDAEGKLSPFKCKAVYDVIRDLHNDKLYGYTAYPEHCMTIEKFKSLLLDCYEKRAYLVWY